MKHADIACEGGARIAPLPLLLACAIALGFALYPMLFVRDGRAAHAAATWALCAMSAGFVRGVGFVPRRALWRWLFSTPACMAFALAALLSLAGGGG